MHHAPCSKRTHSVEDLFCRQRSQRALRPSPTLSPTDPVPRGLLTLCPEASSASRASGPCRRRGHTSVSRRGHTSVSRYARLTHLRSTCLVFWSCCLHLSSPALGPPATSEWGIKHSTHTDASYLPLKYSTEWQVRAKVLA